MNKNGFIFKAIGAVAIPMILFGGSVNAVTGQFGTPHAPGSDSGHPYFDPIGYVPTALQSDTQALVTGQTGLPGPVFFPGEGHKINPTAPTGNWTQVDPNGLYLNDVHTFEAYLVGEGAGYTRNAVGIGIDGDYDLQPGDRQTLFSNINTGSLYDPAHKAAAVTPPPAIMPTDGKLDFFLATQSKMLLWTNTEHSVPLTGFSVNPDTVDGDNTLAMGPKQHAIAFLLNDKAFGNYGSNLDWVLIAWEDLNLGDSDFNDVFMLFGADGIVAVPEPETYLLMGGFLFAGIMLKRRKDAKVKA